MTENDLTFATFKLKPLANHFMSESNVSTCDQTLGIMFVAI